MGWKNPDGLAEFPDELKHEPTYNIQAEPVAINRSQKEFLLLIHVGQTKDGSEAKEIGRRYDVDRDSILIGRGPDNDIVLDLDTVSRRHARIDRRDGRTTLTDLQSTNGTYIDECRIPPHTPRDLPRPARIMVGRAIFKYQAGDDMDLQYTEEMYQLKITDGLTDLPNRRRLMEVLSVEIPRARRYRRDLSLLMMDIDHFKRVNDTLGHLAGDHVLREMAHAVSMQVRQGQLFARYGGEEFVLVLPETTREQAVQTAERLRQMVQNCAFQFADRRIPVTISCGVAAFSGDETDERGLLEIADRNLYRAKEAGRNRVVADGSSDGGPLGVRRVEDAEILLLNLLSAERPYCVAAFDLADERALVECLGSSRRDDWTRELVEDARAAIAPTDFVARHEGRYLVLALDETLTNRDAKALTESVREKWCRREVPAAGAGRIVRKLHVALLGSAEVRVHGARTWDKLIGRLVPESAGGRRADWEGLPGPVALALAEMDASETELGRILAASWAIEMGLRTLAAVGVACGRRNAERRMALAAIVHRFIGKKLSLGGWLDFALDLAKVVSGAPPPLDPVFAGLRDAGADSAPLAVVLREAVEIRNRNYGHARPAADDAFRTEAVRARVIAEQFAKHLTPLSAVFLVSVASIASLKPGGRKKYRLHVHRGCSTGPVVQEHELKTDLFSDWCYLLFPGEQEPLLLAPLMLAGVAEGGRRAETFHADELKLGPEGTLVRGRSVLTKDEFRAELPWTEEASRLFEALNVLGTPGKAGAEETIRIGDEKKE